MRHFPRTITLAALFAVLLALPVLAGDHPGGAFAGRGHRGGLMRCLQGADLTDAQKADFKALFDAARPGFEADVAAIRAARQKLHDDANAGADKSVLGQDYLNAQAARTKLQTDHSAVQDQILAKLTGDQKTKVQSCFASSGQKMGAHSGTQF